MSNMTNQKIRSPRDEAANRTEDMWWAWHDADASRWSPGEDPNEATADAERRCAAWVSGESDDGPTE